MRGANGQRRITVFFKNGNAGKETNFSFKKINMTNEVSDSSYYNTWDQKGTHAGNRRAAALKPEPTERPALGCGRRVTAAPERPG